MSMGVKITNKTKTTNGFLKLFKLDVEQRLHDGTVAHYVREVVERGNAAAILIRDPKTDRLVFNKQFRVGAAMNGETEFLLDIVAGMIDAEDTALNTAIREAEEEVGATNIFSVQKVCETFYPSVGGCSETLAIFYGEADLSNLPQFKGEESESEYIEVVTMPTEEALANMHLFKTAASAVSLMWLKFQRELGNLKD